MKPLPIKLRKNGFDYVQVRRGEKTCIYEQWGQKELIAYEVFKILTVPRRKVKGRWIEAGEKFPANEAFGYSAWTHKTWEGAINRFNELEKSK